VYVSEFSAKTGKASTPRRLTLDEGDRPFDWTADNKAVLLLSDRTGKNNISSAHQRNVGGDVGVGPEDKEICR
jgi:hypothetical protein